MAEQPPASLAQQLQNIETHSKRVSQLATDLSRRIVWFEDWLNNLSGKVEVLLWIQLPQQPDLIKELYFRERFGLKLSRSGKRWILTYAYCDGRRSEILGTTWSPLTEASVDTKLLAVKHFPALFTQIAKNQDKLVRELEEVTRAFDDFAGSVGMPRKEDA